MTTLLTMKGFNKQAQPVTTAGIYRNSTKGVISLSSDGTTWITIADKNLGATQVYNDGDTLSEANAGKYYQWGNNYGFPFTGGVTTSGSQVNASTYGPGNYYSSSTFIARSDGQWDNSGNMNLWGGTTGTNEAMQGPCSNGYHIPTNNELTGLLNLISGMGISISNFNSLKQYLKMSPAGWRARASGNVTLQGSYIRIWSSIGYSTYMAYYINGYSSGLSVTGTQQAEAMNIRPFKNTPVQPDDGGDWETLYTPPEILNFTANTAGSTLRLFKNGSPTAVTFETSTDGSNWSVYTIDTVITLSNIGDKVYFRNASETDTNLSLDGNNYYRFISGDNSSISASGDVMYLLNKNGTKTASYSCFVNLFYNLTSLTTAPKITATTMGGQCCWRMFMGCTNLKTAPELPATNLADTCYYYMFQGCTNLEQLPKLPATALTTYCYGMMFLGCSKIKLSATQTGEYQTAYKIPFEGTGTSGTQSLTNMFGNTGGTWTGTPTINTTYYTSNTVI